MTPNAAFHTAGRRWVMGPNDGCLLRIDLSPTAPLTSADAVWAIPRRQSVSPALRLHAWFRLQIRLQWSARRTGLGRLRLPGSIQVVVQVIVVR
jgi:hypothetical protein